MEGQILRFDAASRTGLIGGDDGHSYDFGPSAISSLANITVGHRVSFSPFANEAHRVRLMRWPTAARPWKPGVPAYAFNLLHVLFSFQGRLRRQHFWIGWLICLGVGAAVSWVPLLGWMLSIALIWPNLAIAVKRLHDMGQSGWLIAIPWVAGMVGLVGMLVTFFSAGLLAADGSGAFETQDPAAIASVFGPALGFVALSFLIPLGFLLWIGGSDSQRAENRFGPDSKVDYRAWASSRAAR